MLPIHRTLPAPTLSGPGPRPALSPGDPFAIAADTRHAPAVATAAASVPLDALLAVQEDGDPGGPNRVVCDRRAKRHGRALLAALGLLQHGLLQPGQGAAPEALRRLAGLLAQPEQAADPELVTVIAQVALRARIELARYGAD